MSPKTHIYFITVSDVQRVAEEIINRRLNENELERVVEQVLENIEWYDPIERSIMDIVSPSELTS